jgi:hypothetical protein
MRIHCKQGNNKLYLSPLVIQDDISSQVEVVTISTWRRLGFEKEGMSLFPKEVMVGVR